MLHLTTTIKEVEKFADYNFGDVIKLDHPSMPRRVVVDILVSTRHLSIFYELKTESGSVSMETEDSLKDHEKVGEIEEPYNFK